MELVQLKREQDFIKEGDLHESLGRFEEALASYDSALTIDPTDADAWFDKGIVLKKMGRSKESEACVETAINLYCGR